MIHGRTRPPTTGGRRSSRAHRREIARAFDEGVASGVALAEVGLAEFWRLHDELPLRKAVDEINALGWVEVEQLFRDDQ